jgi:DNA-directed RNA polymerase specialized sigma24 family protein
VAARSDQDLHALLLADSDRGWRAFVDDQTPALVALIERAGLRDEDEAMEVYTLVCERLAEDDCARLRRWDPARGRLSSWLAVVVRRVLVDWVRSRAGRRRLFGAIQALTPMEQQVFQLYYWNERAPREIAEELSTTSGRTVTLVDVLRALDAVHDVLDARHYSELVSLTGRSRPPVSLDAEIDEGRLDLPDPASAADADIEGRERDLAIEHALASLPAEDAAIVRLHYVQGLSLDAVRRALHIQQLSRDRLKTIVDALRSRLTPAFGGSATAAPTRSAGGARP